MERRQNRQCCLTSFSKILISGVQTRCARVWGRRRIEGGCPHHLTWTWAGVLLTWGRRRITPFSPFYPDVSVLLAVWFRNAFFICVYRPSLLGHSPSMGFNSIFMLSILNTALKDSRLMAGWVWLRLCFNGISIIDTVTFNLFTFEKGWKEKQRECQSI